MRFDAAFIEEIKYRNDLVDVISESVPLRRAGSNLNGLCPFHSEKSPSFTVFPANKSFYCFGCGAGGDVITFVMKQENLDYVAAVTYLANRAGIPLPKEEKRLPGEVSKDRILQMNRDAARFFHDSLSKYPIGRKYLFETRKLSAQTVTHFGLGFAPPWDAHNSLVRYLQQKGYTVPEMKAACLCGISKKGAPYDFFANRVMFPIIDISGNIIGFGGRVMDDAKPKYLNSPDTPAFKKSRNLFALNFAKGACAEQMILCEGYMDVIALHAAGFPYAVATLGTAITPDQARLMKRYTKQVLISYDSDEAGQRASDKAIRLLTEAGLEVRVLHMEGAKDPDEYIKKFGRDKFSLLLKDSRSQFDFRTDAILKKYDLYDPEQKIKAVNEICRLLAGIYSPVSREVYLHRVASRISVSEETLTQSVERILRAQKRQQGTQLLQQSQRQMEGLGDRINPERVHNEKASRAEEAILGLLLLHPEMALEITRGKLALCADDFVTTFHRRVFEEILRQTSESSTFDPGIAAENFTPDEIGRITQLSVMRMDLTQNNETVLADCITALKEAKNSKDLSLQDLLAKRREQK